MSKGSFRVWRRTGYVTLNNSHSDHAEVDFAFLAEGVATIHSAIRGPWRVRNRGLLSNLGPGL